MKIDKIKKIKEKIFTPKKSLEEASSSLLNFIVKSKRENFLKKITLNIPKDSKKISKLTTKIYSKKDALIKTKN